MVHPLGVTHSLGTWRFGSHTVERPTDNATYDAPHPDTSLLLCGPARLGTGGPGTNRQLWAMGQTQNFAYQSSASLAPMMGLGSSRSFFLRGKSSTSWSMQRVLLNGGSILASMTRTLIELGIDPSRFDDPAASPGSVRSSWLTNLDSEYWYIPIGIAMVMRTKAHAHVGGVYLELCMIATYGLQVGAGQSSYTESVTGLCDRVMPFLASDAAEVPPTSAGRDAMDALLGFAANATGETSYTRPGQLNVSPAFANNPSVASI